MEHIKRYGPLLGRILIAIMFLRYGIDKVISFDANLQYVQGFDLPVPPAWVVIGLLIEITGALALLSGFMARHLAVVLGLFSVVTAFVFHTNWGGNLGWAQEIFFWKNMAITGGLLFIAAYGPGPFAHGGNNTK